MCMRTNKDSSFPLTNNSIVNTGFDGQFDDCSELYNKLKNGIQDIILGNTRPFAEAMADVKVKRSK